MTALKAGAQYFALVFAAGLVLGTARVALLQPVTGSIAAVLLELPVILAVAWFSCGVVIRRSRISARIVDRAAMGFAAFLLLLLAEAALSLLLGRTVAEHLVSYRGADAQLGLLAQIAFALFPIVRRPVRRPGRRGASA